jgi:hypothetical protein
MDCREQAKMRSHSRYLTPLAGRKINFAQG